MDASALLALLHNEPGTETVEPALDGALVSTVNWAEVIQKALKRNVDVSGMQEAFGEVGVQFEPFTSAQAEVAAHLWERCRSQGLPFADRACLALATERNLPVLTGDRAWAGLDLGIEIRLLH